MKAVHLKKHEKADARPWWALEVRGHEPVILQEPFDPEEHQEGSPERMAALLPSSLGEIVRGWTERAESIDTDDSLSDLGKGRRRKLEASKAATELRDWRAKRLEPLTEALAALEASIPPVDDLGPLDLTREMRDAQLRELVRTQPSPLTFIRTEADIEILAAVLRAHPALSNLSTEAHTSLKRTVQRARFAEKVEHADAVSDAADATARAIPAVEAAIRHLFGTPSST